MTETVTVAVPMVDLKAQYARKGFKLNLPFEDDFLIVVLSFGILLDVFNLPNLN